MTKKASGIYFILAPDHHGAVQLSQILNNHNDILSLGDGNPSRTQDPICSCGEPASICPFWEEMRAAVNVQEDDPLPKLLPDVPFLLDNPRFNNLANGIGAIAANIFGSRLWRGVYEPAERFLSMHERFLSACYEWFPHKLFVDAERSTLKFMVMASMEFPVKGIIHLIRDPRDYAIAVQNESSTLSADQIGQEWRAGHEGIRRAKRLFRKVPSCVIRYEDLVENQDEVIKKLLSFMRLRDDALPNSQPAMRKHHVLGVTDDAQAKIATDDIQKRQNSLHPDDESVVVLASGPLFSEFGYKSESIT